MANLTTSSAVDTLMGSADLAAIKTNVGAVPLSLTIVTVSSGSLTSNNFNKVTFDTVVTDQLSAWDGTNNEYVAPVTGIYAIFTKLRLNDNDGNGFGYGQGAGTSIADGPSFQWFDGSTCSGTRRNGSLNIRVMALTAADRVKMFYYLSGFTADLSSAEMIIYRLQ